MGKKQFTDEEMLTLLSNPYTAKVTPTTVTFNLEFKRMFMKEYGAGVRITDIFRNAGYDVALLGRPRIDHWSKRIREEAASPEGLRRVRDTRAERLEEFASRELEKESVAKSIKELQKEVVLLEQEVEFLKKTLCLKECPPL